MFRSLREILGENTHNFAYKVQEIQLHRTADQVLMCRATTSVPDAGGSVSNVLVQSQTEWYVEDFIGAVTANKRQPWVQLQLDLAQPQLVRAYSIRVLNKDDPDNPRVIAMSGIDVFRQDPESKNQDELFMFHKDQVFSWNSSDTKLIDIRPRLVQTIKFKIKENHGG